MCDRIGSVDVTSPSYWMFCVHPLQNLLLFFFLVVNSFHSCFYSIQKPLHLSEMPKSNPKSKPNSTQTKLKFDLKQKSKPEPALEVDIELTLLHRVIATLTEQVQLNCFTVVQSSLSKTKSANHPDCKDVDIKAHTCLSLNQKGYVQIKTNSHGKPNEKVQLHQLVLWNHSNPQTRELSRKLILTRGYEVSHLCHNPLCTEAEHLWTEKSEVNKSRRYCEVNFSFNGILFSVCRHTPKCIFTAEKEQKMFAFTNKQD